jgi:hypothetical protein
MLTVFINHQYAAKVDPLDLMRSLSLYPQARLEDHTLTKAYISVEHWTDVAGLIELLRLWNAPQFKGKANA